MRARERTMMMRKRKILMSEVTYSNQAKTLLGRAKMRRVAKTKRVMVAARGKVP